MIEAFVFLILCFNSKKEESDQKWPYTSPAPIFFLQQFFSAAMILLFTSRMKEKDKSVCSLGSVLIFHKILRFVLT